MSPVLIYVLLLGWFQQEEPLKPPYDAVVTVTPAELRSGRQSWKPVVASLKEGDKVSVLEVTEGIVRVKTQDGTEGWMSQRSILPAKTYQSSKAAEGDPKAASSGSASAKGLDPETEDRFRRSENLDAEYKKIDALETMEFRRDAVTLSRRLEAFRKAGGLGEFSK